MKKAISILSVLALTLIFSGTTIAQTISATATVKSEISITNVTNMDFGNVGQNSNPTLDPNGSNSEVGATASIGDLDISAYGGSQGDLVISWNTDVTLSDGTNTMALNEDVDGYTSDTPGSASDLTTSGGTTVTTDASGNYYLFFGGDITVQGSTNTPTGTYNTSNSGGIPLTVEVQYP